jgi:hypothetical protein
MSRYNQLTDDDPREYNPDSESGTETTSGADEIELDDTETGYDPAERQVERREASYPDVRPIRLHSICEHCGDCRVKWRITNGFEHEAYCPACAGEFPEPDGEYQCGVCGECFDGETAIRGHVSGSMVTAGGDHPHWDDLTVEHGDLSNWKV